MKLSIIIPIYNVEKYIQDCLNSIYDGNLEDFEVLCIDDKGNDNSIDIVKEYIKEHGINNLTIIEHEKNKGLSEARNTGINLAVGKYVCFLDSDDMVNPRNLNLLVEEAIRENLDIIEGKLEEITETNVKISSGTDKNTVENTEIVDGDTYFYLMYQKSAYFPMACCRIYKLEYIKQPQYKFVPNLQFEDEVFSPRAIINCSRIKYSNLPFYIYRRRDGSITTNIAKSNKWVESYLKIIDNLSNFSKEIANKKSYPFFKSRIENLTLSILKNPIKYQSSKGNLEEIINIVKKNKLYKIPIKSKNILIKIQGYIMKYPNIFIILYKMRESK